jgi:hypothetical protein
MSKKKIDDTGLLTMFKEGKLQKEIATHFGVSPVAVCKRLKRLLPVPESVFDKFDLTEKEKAFCIEKAKGRNNTQAALASYEAGSLQSAKVIGSQLMDKPEIQQSIIELMDSCGLTRNYRIKKLKQHIDHVDPQASLRALDMSFKLDNSYPPTKSINVNMDVDINPVDLSKFKR